MHIMVTQAISSAGHLFNYYLSAPMTIFMISITVITAATSALSSDILTASSAQIQPLENTKRNKK